MLKRTGTNSLNKTSNGKDPSQTTQPLSQGIHQFGPGVLGKRKTCCSASSTAQSEGPRLLKKLVEKQGVQAPTTNSLNFPRSQWLIHFQ